MAAAKDANCKWQFYHNWMDVFALKPRKRSTLAAGRVRGSDAPQLSPLAPNGNPQL